jgi:hypothetical protein
LTLKIPLLLLIMAADPTVDHCSTDITIELLALLALKSLDVRKAITTMTPRGADDQPGK